MRTFFASLCLVLATAAPFAVSAVAQMPTYSQAARSRRHLPRRKPSLYLMSAPIAVCIPNHFPAIRIAPTLNSLQPSKPPVIARWPTIRPRPTLSSNFISPVPASPATFCPCSGWWSTTVRRTTSCGPSPSPSNLPPWKRLGTRASIPRCPGFSASFCRFPASGPPRRTRSLTE